ncbi:hypothetical protein RR46_04072 [Papilio xuthus]|uniref:Uncharacterized protein n=1 Tax=Papilio xuthus TaxID=66420 RepID=A0A194QN94_PAPXU|nr:hypothetical protein RR46_04072 [Papilio xuthus]
MAMLSVAGAGLWRGVRGAAVTAVTTSEPVQLDFLTPVYVSSNIPKEPHAYVEDSQHRLLELLSFCCFLPFSTIIGASDKQQSTRVTSPFVYVYAATCALHSSDKSCVCG